MKESKKFCVDCVHFKRRLEDRILFPLDKKVGARCNYNGRSYSGVNLVTGKYLALHVLPSCELERSSIGGNCGPEAKFFESKNGFRVGL